MVRPTTPDELPPPLRRARASRGAGRVLDGRAGGVSRLVLEHLNIGRLLVLLEHGLGPHAAGADPDFQLALDVVDYLTSFVDRFHHVREDRFFEHLARRVPALEAASLAIQRAHEAIIAGGGRLRALLEQVVADEPVARGELHDAVLGYAHGLRAHMQQEEELLIPALGELDPVALAELEAELDEEDDPLFGRAVQTRYLALSDALWRAAVNGKPPLGGS